MINAANAEFAAAARPAISESLSPGAAGLAPGRLNLAVMGLPAGTAGLKRYISIYNGVFLSDYLACA